MTFLVLRMVTATTTIWPYATLSDFVYYDPAVRVLALAQSNQISLVQSFWSHESWAGHLMYKFSRNFEPIKGQKILQAIFMPSMLPKNNRKICLILKWEHHMPQNSTLLHSFVIFPVSETIFGMSGCFPVSQGQEMKDLTASSGRKATRGCQCSFSAQVRLKNSHEYKKLFLSLVKWQM